MGDEVEVLAKVLRENGLSDKPGEFDSDIHSWRCRYPDRYGPCSCFQELVADLAARVQDARAEAWDRCSREMALNALNSATHEAALRSMRANPYRLDAVQDTDEPTEEGR